MINQQFDLPFIKNGNKTTLLIVQDKKGFIEVKLPEKTENRHDKYQRILRIELKYCSFVVG